MPLVLSVWWSAIRSFVYSKSNKAYELHILHSFLLAGGLCVPHIVTYCTADNLLFGLTLLDVGIIILYILWKSTAGRRGERSSAGSSGRGGTAIERFGRFPVNINRTGLPAASRRCLEYTPNLTNYSNREKWQRMVRSSEFAPVDVIRDSSRHVSCSCYGDVTSVKC